MKFLENRIPPPIVVFVLVVSMRLVAMTAQRLPSDSPAPSIFGLALMFTGLSTAGLGVLEFRRSRTTIDPVQIDAASALVTTGIFRLTRNPMYLGFTTLLVGWSIYLQSPIALFGPLAFVLFTNRFQIQPEEEAMTYKFGGQYSTYKQHVRRWI